MQHTLRKTEMRCALFTPQTVNGVSSHLRRVNSIFGHLAALAKRLFALPGVVAGRSISVLPP